MSFSPEPSAGPGGAHVPRGPLVFVAVLTGLIGFAVGYVVADHVWLNRAAKLRESYQAALERQEKSHKLVAAILAAQAAQTQASPATQP